MPTGELGWEYGGELTNHHHHKTPFVLHHLGHLREQLLDELSGLGEPLGEQRVRVDLDELPAGISEEDSAV